MLRSSRVHERCFLSPVQPWFWWRRPVCASSVHVFVRGHGWKGGTWKSRQTLPHLDSPPWKQYKHALRNTQRYCRWICKINIHSHFSIIYSVIKYIYLKTNFLLIILLWLYANIFFIIPIIIFSRDECMCISFKNKNYVCKNKSFMLSYFWNDVFPNSARLTVLMLTNVTKQIVCMSIVNNASRKIIYLFIFIRYKRRLYWVFHWPVTVMIFGLRFAWFVQFFSFCTMCMLKYVYMNPPKVVRNQFFIQL